MLLKEKHIEMKELTEGKAHAMGYTRVMSDQMLSLKDSDTFENVITVLESLTSQLNKYGICSDVVKDEGCKLNQISIKGILDK